MNISAIEIEMPKAEDVRVIRDTLTVDLSDGRTIAVPLEWYPRLVKATPEEKKIEIYRHRQTVRQNSDIL